MASVRESTGSYSVLVGKREGKRPLDIPRRRRENNIKMYLQGIGWGGVHWIDLPHDMENLRDFVNAVMNFRVP